MEQARRSISHYTHYVAGTPEKTFPLLCPVREYEWIETWRGKLLYADSGVAELDCIFVAAPFEALGPETWSCTHFDPQRRIDYVRMSPHTVIRLEIQLFPAGEGTRLETKMVFTALDAKGDAFVAGCNGLTCETHFKACWTMLDHYLRTGRMLPAAEAVAIAQAQR